MSVPLPSTGSSGLNTQGTITYTYGPGADQARFLKELATAEEGSYYYDKYLADLDPFVRELLRLSVESPYAIHQSFAPGYRDRIDVPAGLSQRELMDLIGLKTYNRIFNSPVREDEELARRYIEWATNVWNQFQQLFGLTGQEAYDALVNALDMYATRHKAGYPGAFVPVSGDRFLEWLSDWASINQALAGNLDSYRQQYLDWLNRYSWTLTPEQRSFYEALFPDLANYYLAKAQQDVINNANFLKFLEGYLSPFHLLSGVDEKLSQTVRRDPLPILSDQNSREFFMSWLSRQEGLSPEQRERLQSAYNELWGRYFAEKSANPYAWASFEHFLSTINPVEELLRLPETDQQQTFLNWVADLRGLTPQQRALLESRFAPIFAQYFVQQQTNPNQQLRFLDYLNQLDPLSQIRFLPPGAPYTSQRTFGSRLRWLGY